MAFPPRTVAVLLVEPHEIVRRGLLDMLASLPLVSRARATDSVRTATRQLAAEPADIVVSASGVDPSDVYDLIETAGPSVRLLHLIRNNEPGSLAIAARVPAHGFAMESDLSIETLAQALTGVVSGMTPVPSALAAFLLARARASSTGGAVLTAREREVLRLLSVGMSNKEIGQHLGISTHGAKRHVGNLLAKFNVPNRTLAVARAMDQGLLSSQP